MNEFIHRIQTIDSYSSTNPTNRTTMSHWTINPQGGNYRTYLQIINHVQKIIQQVSSRHDEVGEICYETPPSNHTLPLSSIQKHETITPQTSNYSPWNPYASRHPLTSLFYLMIMVHQKRTKSETKRMIKIINNELTFETNFVLSERSGQAHKKD